MKTIQSLKIRDNYPLTNKLRKLMFQDKLSFPEACKEIDKRQYQAVYIKDSEALFDIVLGDIQYKVSLDET